MRFPLKLTFDLTKYLVKTSLRRIERYPLVLMLEPTHRCNLACSGCGRIREYEATLKETISLSRCLEAVDECPAPVVTITGGEPLLYEELGALVDNILRKGRHIQLCTNGLLLSECLDTIPNHNNLTINVHLDGLTETHERIIDSKGSFEKIISAIRGAKKKGFRVCTNTTVFRETDMQEIETLFDLLSSIGTDGILVAPGFEYGEVKEDIFLARQEINRKFKQIIKMSGRYSFWSTPPYLRLLAGETEMECTPWGNPTFNPLGWKAPCYLITDQHYQTYQEMMEHTDWERYGIGKDERCSQCMMHCGFEPTVVRETGKSLSSVIEMMRWNFT